MPETETPPSTNVVSYDEPVGNRALENLLPLAEAFTERCLYRRLVPERSDVINLTFNENPLGPSQAAVDAIRSLAPNINLYPNVSGPKLISEISKITRVDESRIMLGFGATDICGQIGLAFLSPTATAIASTGSLFAYRFAAEIFGAGLRRVPLLPTLHQDLKAISASINERTRLIFLASPNNPTGLEIPEQEIFQLLDSLPRRIILVLDQAYLHYSSERRREDYFLKKTLSRDNLIVLRTFSKAYGLAGLRVGYAIAAPRLISRLKTCHRLTQPSGISLLAEGAAVAALSDEGHVEASRRHVVELREHLIDLLNSKGIQTTKSQSNFLFVRLGRHERPAVRELESHGFLVTSGTDLQLPGWIRFSISSEEDTTRLTEILRTLPYE